MPLSPYQNDQRDLLADALMPSRADSSPLAQTMAALPGNLTSQMTTAMPAGMPATPAGGVPGSGIGPTGPAVVPQMPNATGLQGAMQYKQPRGMQRGMARQLY